MAIYRISKYDPEKRLNGAYKINEWTEYSDIGRIFFDGELTEDRYVSVEKNYINCVLSVLQYLHINKLIVKELEKYDAVLWENGQQLNEKDFAIILEDCLRNRCWCKLNYGKTVIDFGYDYYIHINCDICIDDMKKICEGFLLFVEKM